MCRAWLGRPDGGVDQHQLQPLGRGGHHLGFEIVGSGDGGHAMLLHFKEEVISRDWRLLRHALIVKKAVLFRNVSLLSSTFKSRAS